MTDHWDRNAHAWAAWTRREGHDSYWDVRERFFGEIVPPPRRRTLEIGCGEGRVCRDLRDRGHRVTGVDAAPTMVELAREADDESEYVLADAAALPFTDASFDLVVSYNALMDLDDPDTALHEAARVLTRDGVLAVCVVHPMAYVYKRRGDRFVYEPPYFDRRAEDLTVTRDGLTMTFLDRPHTLEAYLRPVVGAGFAIERLREISDDDPPVRPQFMFLRCVKRAL